MFAFLKGSLIEVRAQKIILDVNGIGYEIYIPASVLTRLPQLGSAVLLHTCFVVRENSQALYGFLSHHEKEMFEVLINVSGIGPKLGLSIIGHLPLDVIQEAISRNDIVTISKVPGIGKKMAEKLIVELRDKLPGLFSSNPSDYSVSIPLDSRSQVIQDAMSALTNLGYSQIKAKKAIEQVIEKSEEEYDLTTLITLSLKNV